MCDNIGQDISSEGNALNEKRVSLTRCIDLAGTSYGHIGQNACTSIEPPLTPEGKLTEEINYALKVRIAVEDVSRPIKQTIIFSCVQNFLTR